MCEDLFEALNLSSKEVETVACTDGENGAYIINKGELIHVHAKSVKIIDTTGAGDLFAAGFLWGMVNGYDIKTSGRMGCIAGSNMVTQFGARPKDGLIKLFESEALI
jgi:sugar/nucleoside kinase (ribokinase family)